MFPPLVGGAGEKGCVRVQHEPLASASGLWAGTASLTPVMLPSRDLAPSFRPLQNTFARSP